MFLSDTVFACRTVLSHSSPTGKAAAGIVAGAALLVAIGAVPRSEQTPNPIAKNDVKLISAKHVGGTPSRLLFPETDPAWYAARFLSEAALVASPQESSDVKASMVNGHIQAFWACHA
jgi:hypothetical protein